MSRRLKMQNDYYAAADCGTNSFHMIVVKVKEDDYFEIITREREIIRLGNTSSNIISAESMARSILTLHRFKEIAESYHAPLEVVATSAVRNSLNQDEFLEKVKKNTGISVRVLTGAEEAKLTYSGVTKAIPSDNTTLCIDIGGGSTEFIIGREGKILFTNSIDIGAVKLSRKYFNEDYSYNYEQIDECCKWTLSEISKIKPDIKKYNFKEIIGASGTIISAASMVTSGTADLNKYHLKKDDLKNISESIFRYTTVEQRKSVAGLEPARADIMPAGLIILNSILEVLDIEEMIVSLYGLREGIIVETFL